MKTMIERYRELPEVGHVPDEAEEIDAIDSDIASMEKSISDLRSRRSELKTRVIEYARRDWSDEEIAASGILEA